MNLPSPFSRKPLVFPSQTHLLKVDVSNKRLKLGTSRNSHIQCLGSKEGLQVKQVEIVVIHKVSEQLVGQSVQRGHHRQGELPTLVG